MPSAVPIPNPDDRSEFINAVRLVSEHPRLIIIDTLARNFGDGNESLAQDMNAFVRGCDDLRVAFPGTTVLAVHHSGKDQNKGARGSLALKGAADAEFQLIRSGNTLTLRNNKQKDNEEAEPIALKLEQVGLPDGNTSLVVRSANPGTVRCVAAAPRVDPRTVKTDTSTLETLAGFGRGGASLAEWQRVSGRAKDTFYKSRDKSRDRLIEAGKVRFDAESAHYVAVKVCPGPEQVQNRMN